MLKNLLHLGVGVIKLFLIPLTSRVHSMMCRAKGFRYCSFHGIDFIGNSEFITLAEKASDIIASKNEFIVKRLKEVKASFYEDQYLDGDSIITHRSSISRKFIAWGEWGIIARMLYAQVYYDTWGSRKNEQLNRVSCIKVGQEIASKVAMELGKLDGPKELVDFYYGKLLAKSQGK